MFTVSADFKDMGTARNIQYKHRNLKGAITQTLNQSAARGVSVARKSIKRNITGNLAKSINWYTTGEYSRQISVGAYYGRWVEKGRRGFCAKNTKFLRFRKDGWGPYIFTRCVGPAKPRPFMRPAFDFLKWYFPMMLQQRVRNVLNGGAATGW